MTDAAAFLEGLGGWNVGNGPLYRRLATALEAAIRAGTWRPHAALPSERALADALGLSRATVVSAYERLADAGLVYVRRGSGTRVAALAGEAGVPAQIARSSVFRERANAPLVDLTLGAPAAPPDGFAAAALSTLAAALEGGAMGGYAPLGYGPLREALARMYARDGLPTDPEQILVTNGAQQAISLVATLAVESGERVAVENPTYFGALDAFRARDARLVELNVDVPESIATARVAYVMATLHNPTGRVLDAERRSALRSIAERSGTLVVDDATLADLHFTAPQPTLAHDRDDPRTLVLGSLSKSAWAALRIGWIRGARTTIERLGRCKAVADLGTTPLVQALAVDLIARIGDVRDARVRALRASSDAMQALLRARLPAWSWDAPEGGFSLWIRLPGVDADRFADAAERRGVAVTPGGAASLGRANRDRIRIATSGDPAGYGEAVDRLAAAWDAVTRERAARS